MDAFAETPSCVLEPSCVLRCGLFIVEELDRLPGCIFILTLCFAPFCKTYCYYVKVAIGHLRMAIIGHNTAEDYSQTWALTCLLPFLVEPVTFLVCPTVLTKKAFLYLSMSLTFYYHANSVVDIVCSIALSCCSLCILVSHFQCNLLVPGSSVM